jgi:hypothetical protein
MAFPPVPPTAKPVGYDPNETPNKSVVVPEGIGVHPPLLRSRVIPELPTAQPLSALVRSTALRLFAVAGKDQTTEKPRKISNVNNAMPRNTARKLIPVLIALTPSIMVAPNLLTSNH